VGLNLQLVSFIDNPALKACKLNRFVLKW